MEHPQVVVAARNRNLHACGDLAAGGAALMADPQDEAVRDLIRARYQVQRQQHRARQQLKMFLLRHNFRYAGTKAWTAAHRRYLDEIMLARVTDGKVNLALEYFATLTAQQPMNNVVRVAVQAMAGIFGGLQSLHTDSYDEALSTPTDAGARIAVATQNILREEAHLTDVIDPLGGSYYVETLTDEMEREWSRFYPLGRLGRAEDIAPLIAFLASSASLAAWSLLTSRMPGWGRICVCRRSLPPGRTRSGWRSGPAPSTAFRRA